MGETPPAVALELWDVEQVAAWVGALGGLHAQDIAAKARAEEVDGRTLLAYAGTLPPLDREQIGAVRRSIVRSELGLTAGQVTTLLWEVGRLVSEGSLESATSTTAPQGTREQDIVPNPLQTEDFQDIDPATSFEVESRGVQSDGMSADLELDPNAPREALATLYAWAPAFGHPTSDQRGAALTTLAQIFPALGLRFAGYFMLSSYCFLHLNGTADDGTFARVLAASFWVMGFFNMVICFLAATRLVRPDGAGMLDALLTETPNGRNLHSPLAPGAIEKCRAIDKKLRGEILSMQPFMLGVAYGLFWFFGVLDISEWLYIPLYFVNVYANSAMALELAMAHACTVITAAQIDALSERLLKVAPPTGELGYVEGLSYVETSREVFRLHHHVIPACEGAVNVFTAASWVISIVAGAVVLYGGAMGHFGNQVVSIVMEMLGGVFMFVAFWSLSGLLAVTASCGKLRAHVSDLRLLVPAANLQEVQIIVEYTKDLNDGQGPGHTMLGVIVKPSAVWGAFASVLMVVIGALVSTLG
jgi:hypothetical protein